MANHAFSHPDAGQPLAVIRDVPPAAMILIRADLSRTRDAIAQAFGVACPPRCAIVQDGADDHHARCLLWMSPDELLAIAPLPARASVLDALSGALKDAHALVADVSDMRAGFDVTGPGAADVIAKLCPVDLAGLPDGMVRRTRAAQIACALWRIEGGFRILAFRSVQDYLRQLLTVAARAGTGLAPPEPQLRPAG